MRHLSHRKRHNGRMAEAVGPREVVIVVFDGMKLLDAAGPAEVFAEANRFGADYRLLRDPTHISLFSNDSMHRFLRAHGFHIDAVDYPFFETRHFTADNLVQMLDRDDVSPPFYGSFMTFYCTRV